MDQQQPHMHHQSDQGFTLIEVVVAMAVFSILAGSVFGVLTAALRATGDNNRRSVAAGLATEQIEQARSLRALDIPDGLTTLSRTVGGTTYSVAQSANYVTVDSDASVCLSSGNQLTYKLVRVEVSWPEMGTTRPATADTLRALGIGADGLATGTGALAVLVTGANGNPVVGTVVSLSPGGATRTTGTDGCAVFTQITPGDVTASIDQPGRVASTGRQAISTAPQSISAGRVTRTAVFHDVARSRPFDLAPPAGYTVPAGLPVELSGSLLPDTQVPACSSPAATCATAVPGTLQNLFPDTYTVWAGSCSDAQSTAPATFDATPTAAGATVSVPLGGVSAKTASLLGGSSSTPLYAVHADESGAASAAQCLGGERYPLGPAGSTPVLTALPMGTWTITTSATGTNLGDPEVTLTSSSPTADATVVVP